jgi:hypothetical protein
MFEDEAEFLDEDDLLDVAGYDGDGPVCRGCGCTEGAACEGGCIWAEADLCSACALGRNH